MSEAGNQARGLRPGVPMRGTLRLPGSKSHAQRASIAASLAFGTTRIVGLRGGLDMQAALALIEASGATVQRLAPAAFEITGRPPGLHRGWSSDRPLDAGESGTLARFATAAAALCGVAGREHALRVQGTLAKRRSAPLFDALRASGVVFTPTAASTPRDAHDRPIGWPVSIRALGPPSDLCLENPESSQEVSALLIALAAWPDAIRLEVRGRVPSRPYLSMTLAVLERFGARIESRSEGPSEIFETRGPLAAPAEPIVIEPDASAAAVALAAACLSDGSLTIPGLTARSIQGDVRIVEHLARFGIHARVDDDGVHAAGFSTHGADIDLEGEPDLAPVIAAIGAAVAWRAPSGARQTSTRSRLRGLGTLQSKESARIAVLAQGLSAIGLDVRATTDELAIAPRRSADQHTARAESA